MKKYAILRGNKVHSVELYEQEPPFIKTIPCVELKDDIPKIGSVYNPSTKEFEDPEIELDSISRSIQYAVDAYTVELIKEGIL